MRCLRWVVRGVRGVHGFPPPTGSYLRVLPAAFSTPLFWPAEHVAALRPSPAHLAAVQQARHIARQYAYLSSIVGDYKGLFPENHFTYDDYRWVAGRGGSS